MLTYNIYDIDIALKVVSVISRRRPIESGSQTRMNWAQAVMDNWFIGSSANMYARLKLYTNRALLFFCRNKLGRYCLVKTKDLSISRLHDSCLSFTYLHKIK